MHPGLRAAGSSSAPPPFGAAPPSNGAPPPAGGRPAAGSSAAAGAPAAPNPNGVVVSSRQRGNPVLQAIKAVPWSYGPTTADFSIADGQCAALFVSLRYHLLHPNYLLARLRELKEPAALRLVLLLVDSEAPEKPILQVLHLSMAHECTLLLSWSANEAARQIETMRAYAKKGAETLKERSDGTFLSQLSDVLTTSRLVNKTDVATLHATFGSLARVMTASEHELALCPGLGHTKVRRLREAFHEPFIPRYARVATLPGAAPVAAPGAQTSAAACSTAAPPPAPAAQPATQPAARSAARPAVVAAPPRTPATAPPPAAAHAAAHAAAAELVMAMDESEMEWEDVPGPVE